MAHCFIQCAMFYAFSAPWFPFQFQKVKATESLKKLYEIFRFCEIYGNISVWEAFLL